jgi:hypothetical protein
VKPDDKSAAASEQQDADAGAPPVIPPPLIAGRSSGRLRTLAWIALALSVLVTLAWPVLAFGCLLEFGMPAANVWDVMRLRGTPLLLLSYPWGLVVLIIRIFLHRRDGDWRTKRNVMFMAAPVVHLALVMTGIVIAQALLHGGFLPGVGYRKVGGKWAWVVENEGVGWGVSFIPGADGGTFHVLADPDYAADAHAAYFDGVTVTNADPRSFRQIKDYYWRDNHRVFLMASEIKGTDPETFRLLPGSGWARDRNDAYYRATPLNVRDIATFTLLGSDWARDSKAYYCGSSIMDHSPGANVTVACDYASFVILNKYYAKDKNRAYWLGIPIEGSDAGSFEAINFVTAKDKYRQYSGAKAATHD